jgi:hypothetical protein
VIVTSSSEFPTDASPSSPPSASSSNPVSIRTSPHPRSSSSPHYNQHRLKKFAYSVRAWKNGSSDAGNSERAFLSGDSKCGKKYKVFGSPGREEVGCNVGTRTGGEGAVSGISSVMGSPPNRVKVPSAESFVAKIDCREFMCTPLTCDDFDVEGFSSVDVDDFLLLFFFLGSTSSSNSDFLDFFFGFLSLVVSILSAFPF